MGNYTVYVNPYIVLKSGGYTKHFYIEGQRIVSKLGGDLSDATKSQKAGGGKINYPDKQEGSREGIVRNLKWSGRAGWARMAHCLPQAIAAKRLGAA
jgi:hypothetical protein